MSTDVGVKSGHAVIQGFITQMSNISNKLNRECIETTK